LAQSQLASAGQRASQQSSAAQSQGDLAPAGARGEPGTVKPPPVVVPPINAPGTYSAGGVCTVIVQSISDPTSLHVNLLPFDTVRDRPQETERYRAGVCQLVFVKNGQGVTDVTAVDAVVKVCFAAIPNETNQIYVYVWQTQTWFALETTVENGLACAPATKTGRYVMMQMP
jgi:hypothetical protein